MCRALLKLHYMLEPPKALSTQLKIVTILKIIQWAISREPNLYIIKESRILRDYTLDTVYI